MRAAFFRGWTVWAWMAACSWRLVGGEFETRLATMEATAKSQPTNAAIRFEIGRFLHWEGTQGRKDVGEPAVRWLRECLKLQSDHAFARALVGSSLTLQARDATFPTTRLRLVKAGIAEMDAAARMAPDDPNVRFTRASNNLFLPGFFKREAIVKSDFAWLDEQVRTRPAVLGTEFCQWTHCFHGLAEKKFGDAAAAERLWADGVKLDPKSEAARRIRRECQCELP